MLTMTHTARLSLNLTPSLMTRLRIYCATKGVNLTTVVSFALISYLPAPVEGGNDTSSEYITTRPVPASLVGAIQDMVPSWCRSVTCLHGDGDNDPVTFGAHRSEARYLRRAIRSAKAAAAVAHIR